MRHNNIELTVQYLIKDATCVKDIYQSVENHYL